MKMKVFVVLSGGSDDSGFMETDVFEHIAVTEEEAKRCIDAKVKEIEEKGFYAITSEKPELILPDNAVFLEGKGGLYDDSFWYYYEPYELDIPDSQTEQVL